MSYVREEQDTELRFEPYRRDKFIATALKSTTLIMIVKFYFTLSSLAYGPASKGLHRCNGLEEVAGPLECDRKSTVNL